ncbi:MAG: chemotaxis protein CheW [Anaerocolumna aminovalerica]|jgi:purine-binding chemotaxis protein CheW|uniref:chemotaxis protein CheW n=1 Tax=Anaerocolumna aminovalerica TaxID=1527 RepID=UPI0029124BCD|nr:chemotaxis protein CheW [Anaerocolumna aminovalerica]MDU6266341.1 chemotaxis protein CheW [Anaerocolumna aminovalerica]
MAQMEVLNMHLQEQEEDTLKGKYLLFFVGSEIYGLEIRHITEIIGVQPITSVIGMPEYVRGVTNLRGKVIPVIDARMRFKKAVREYDDRTCIIVIDFNDISVGLVVDTVLEVVTIQDENITPLPDISNDGCNYIRGIGRVRDKINLLLDCQRILEDNERNRLKTMS